MDGQASSNGGLAHHWELVGSHVQQKQDIVATVGYREIYKDVNQLMREVVPHAEGVMVVHSMWVNLGSRIASEVLEKRRRAEPTEVLVVADVVELDTGFLRLPDATSRLVILCRLLIINSAVAEDAAPAHIFNGRYLNVAGMTVNTQWTDTLTPARSPWAGTARRRFCASCNAEIHIYAQRLHVSSHGQATSVHNSSIPPLPLLLSVRNKSDDQWLTWGACGIHPRSGRLLPIRRDDNGLLEGPLFVKQADLDELEKSVVVSLYNELIPAKLLADRYIIECMQTTLLTAELILKYQANAHSGAAAIAARQHVEWLAFQIQGCVADATAHSTLTALLVRAQSILKLPPRVCSINMVPKLTYRGYREVIEKVADAADKYNQRFSELSNLIQASEMSDASFAALSRVLAQAEAGIEAYHKKLVDMKKGELVAASERLDKLKKQLDAQKAAMDDAENDANARLKQYEQRQAARAIFGVFTAIFAFGAAIFTGGMTAGVAIAGVGEAVKAAGSLTQVWKLLQKIGKLVQVMAAIQKLLQSLSNLNELIDAPQLPSLPTPAEWELFQNEILSVARQLPIKVDVWEAKCKNVVAVGKEIFHTAACISQIQYELLVQSLQAEAADKSRERLEELSRRVTDRHDLEEMARNHEALRLNLHINLLSLLDLQHGALRYHFLLEPKLFTSWVDVDAATKALLANELTIVENLSVLHDCTERTVHYRVDGIPVKLLESGQPWVFRIDVPDHSHVNDINSEERTTGTTNIPKAKRRQPFAHMGRVRIEYMIIRFAQGAAAPETDGDEVRLLMEASGLFEDLNPTTNEIVQYEANFPLEYGYSYDLLTGEEIVSNRSTTTGGLEDFWVRMTPFTTWRLSLPRSAYENDGLCFHPSATTTSVDITFHVTNIHLP